MSGDEGEKRYFGKKALSHEEKYSFEVTARVAFATWEAREYGDYLVLELENSSTGEMLRRQYRYSLNPRSKYMRLQKALVSLGIDIESEQDLVSCEFKWRGEEVRAGVDAQGEPIVSFVLLPYKIVFVPDDIGKKGEESSKVVDKIRGEEKEEEEEEDKERWTKICAKIMKFLEDTPYSITELSTELKLSETEVEYAVSKLKKLNKVVVKRGIVSLPTL